MYQCKSVNRSVSSIGGEGGNNNQMAHELIIDKQTNSEKKKERASKRERERSVEDMLAISYTNTINLRLSSRSFVRLVVRTLARFIAISILQCLSVQWFLPGSLAFAFASVLCYAVKVLAKPFHAHLCWFPLIRFSVLFYFIWYFSVIPI